MIKNCKYCGSSELVIVQKDENRYGLYCKECDRWLKWVRKQELSNNNSDAYKIRKFVDSLNEEEFKKVLRLIAEKL